MARSGRMGDLLVLLLVGAVIGALARLVMPGRQPVGILVTIALGMLGALAGYSLSDALDISTLVRWLLSIGIAVVLISLYVGLTGRRR